MKNFFVFAICILTVVLIIHSCSGGGGSTVSVDEFQRRTREKLNKELMNPSSEFRNAVFSRIEKAHVTVTAKSAEITKCNIRTIDGSDSVKNDGENVLSYDYNVRVRWDGVFHKNGSTTLNIIQQRNNKGEYGVQSAQIIQSDAVVNVEDPDFWYGVGFAAGVLLL